MTTKHLKLHERKHTGEKLKQCPICNAEFAKTSHLVRHMTSHNKPTDNYKHICPQCGMGFTRAHQLIKHKQECEVEEKLPAKEENIVENKENLDDSGSVDDANDTNFEPAANDDDDDDEDDVPLANVKKEIEDELDEDIPLDTIPKLRLKKERIEQDDKVHPCKVCNKILTKAGLRYHMRRHTGTHLQTCYVN